MWVGGWVTLILVACDNGLPQKCTKLFTPTDTLVWPNILIIFESNHEKRLIEIAYQSLAGLRADGRRQGGNSYLTCRREQPITAGYGRAVSSQLALLQTRPIFGQVALGLLPSCPSESASRGTGDGHRRPPTTRETRGETEKGKRM